MKTMHMFLIVQQILQSESTIRKISFLHTITNTGKKYSQIQYKYMCLVRGLRTGMRLSKSLFSSKVMACKEHNFIP